MENFSHILVQVLRRNLFILVLLVFLVSVYTITHQREGADPATIEEEQAAALVLAPSEPMRLRIPAIGIDAPFEEPLGVDENREIEVPKSFDTVGWYKYGPTPGELGPAVVLGHVDSRVGGPEVFYNLKDLEIGDRVEIEREDGSIAAFEVTELRSVSQNNFPTQDVYGNIDHAGLRLITCSGTYDRGKARYSHNLIVFARLLKNP